MNKRALKIKKISILFLVSAISQGSQALGHDIEKLTKLLGPERAQQFMQKLQNKNIQQKNPSKEIHPAPVIPKPEPVKPAEPEWLSEQEKHDFNQTVATMQVYMRRVYTCLDSFLNKRNSDPYGSHVSNFKSQLQFLQQAVLQKLPTAQTPAGNKIFNWLRTIAKSLENTQSAMCHTLDRDYTQTWLPAKALGDELEKLTDPINQQRAIIDQQIAALRNELRNAQAQAMLTEINKLFVLMNRTFDYGNRKSRIELGMILMHRLKR